MKNQKISGIKAIITLACFVTMSSLLSSCNKTTDPISGEVLQTANNDAAMNVQTSEAEDIATNQLNVTDPSGREAAGLDDDRLSCATITRSPNSDKSAGSVTIDFGTSCTDSKGNVRKGKIMISWAGGRWFNAGSTHTITFSGYSINDVKFSDSDSRAVGNISTPSSPLTFTVVATHNLTWPDATTASLNLHHIRQWIRSANFTDDKFIISQTPGATSAANGTNRHNKTYSVQITVPLEFSRACAISNKVFKPVKGVRVITFDTNKTVTIDFGTGTCDNTFTVSTAGHTKTVTAKNDSSGD